MGGGFFLLRIRIGLLLLLGSVSDCVGGYNCDCRRKGSIDGYRWGSAMTLDS